MRGTPPVSVKQGKPVQAAKKVILHCKSSFSYSRRRSEQAGKMMKHKNNTSTESLR